MAAPASFTLPVVSFRQLETPFTKPQGYRDYFAVVEIKHLPELTGWRRINVRDPRLTGIVPNAIRESAQANPELFVFMNRGIVLSVDSVSFDNQASAVTITLTDPELHGLLDGGHTYNILMEERDGLGFPQHVKLEILQGFKNDQIPELVDARNTSNQVREQSLSNLRGEFDNLKRALGGQPYADLIAYKEYETGDDGKEKPIDVRDLIAMLTVFDKDHFDDQTHPINAYRSKGWCLKHFIDNLASFEKIYPVAPEILRLYDLVQVHLPDLYNRATGGRFGALTGVNKYSGKRRPKLPFTNMETTHAVPAGFVYPVLGAFRPLLKEQDGRYMWAKGISAEGVLDGDLGVSLARTIGNFALEHRNPSKTGKSQAVWESCYRLGQVAYLSKNNR